MKSYSDSKKVVLTSCYSGKSKWELVSVGNGKYRVKSKASSGKYLGVKKIKKNGSRLVNSSNARQVKFLAKTDDTFFVKFANRGHVWDVSRGKINKEGAKVLQYRFHGGNNQQWRVHVVKDSIDFNFRTFRKSSSYSSNRSSSGSKHNLRRISHDQFSLEGYFACCTSSQFSSENSGNFLVTDLNRRSLSKRLVLVEAIIKGTMKNRDSTVHSAAFRILTDVDFAGGNFLERAVKGKVKKTARKALAKENNYSARMYLKRFMQKL